MTRNGMITQRVIAGTACGILLLALGSTLAIGAGAPVLLRLPFRLMCHGIESRCLFVGGTAMPICARCSGIYAGMFFATLLFPLIARLWRLLAGKAFLTLAVLPLAIDGVTQAIGFRESTNTLRIITGIVAGCALAMWSLAQIESFDPAQSGSARHAGAGGSYEP